MKFLNAILVASLVVVGGCGQNKHVTGSDPASSGSQSSNQEAPQVVTDEEESAEDEELADTDSDTIIEMMTDIPADETQEGTPVATNGTDGQGGNGGNGGNGGEGQDGTDGTNGTNGQTPVATNGTDGQGGNGGAGGAGGEGTTGDDGANGGNGTNGANGLAGQPGNQGPAGRDGQDGAPGASSSIDRDGIIREILGQLEVRDGNDGLNGRDGRDGRDQCWMSPLPSVAGSVDPSSLQRYSQSGTDLPYLTQPRSGARAPRLGVLTLGQGRVRGTGRLCSPVRGESNYNSQCWVKDAMVVFTVHVDLPARIRLVPEMPFTAILQLEILKRSSSSPRYDGTEILCLLNNKICSGEAFVHDGSSHDFSVLINDQFSSNPMLNTRFGDELRSAAALSRASHGNRRGINWNQTLNVDLAQAFAPAGQERLDREALISLLYGDADPLEPVSRELRFVVADDVLVKSANMVMNYNYNTCEIPPMSEAVRASLLRQLSEREEAVAVGQ